MLTNARRSFVVLGLGFSSLFTMGVDSCGVDSDADGYYTCGEGGGPDCDCDCDDGNPAVYPGAAETCNEIDDNCDGQLDEGVTTTYYFDTDGDGYGDQNGATVQACTAPIGYADDTDCNDTNAAIYPGATELEDGSDNDCDGTIDEGTNAYDDDGDGYSENGGDCNDANAMISPVGIEQCDGKDNDCDGKVDSKDTAYIFSDYPDADGWGIVRDDAPLTSWPCSSGFVPYGYAWKLGDCESNHNDLVYPGATEFADGLDNDCDGVIDEDVDGVDNDGDGYSEADGDCNDADAGVSPELPENPFSGEDEDCDGSHQDYDADGHVTYTWNDCNDFNSTVYYGGVEVCDDLDNDCDHYIDENVVDCPSASVDSDGDGYTPDQGDCDDANPETWRNAVTGAGAEELCDGLDNDCDWYVDELWFDDECPIPVVDQDWDGWTTEEGDCVDYNATVYPGAVEVEDDNLDNDCDGSVDEVP